jgi:hypothetical protein
MMSLAVALASIGASEASAACSVPPDVLPVPLANAAAAPALRTGADSTGGATWVISGFIRRCVDGGSSSVEIATPPEMGITKIAAIHMAISGVALVPESQLAQNKSTEWRLNSVPVVKIADPNNADESKNRLEISWNASFVNVASYELAYTLYLTQK